MMFRQLSSGEESQFRAWAWNNYKPGDPIREFWHPVIREECEKINQLADAESENDWIKNSEESS